MTMEKSRFLYLFLFAALFGVLTCATVAYAAPCTEGDAGTHSQGIPCHSVCHTNHHHWISTDALTELSQMLNAEKFLPVSEQLHIDPIASSIFHPPAVA